MNKGVFLMLWKDKNFACHLIFLCETNPLPADLLFYKTFVKEF